MTYLDELGTQIRERVPRRLLPDVETASLFRLYAVLALAKGVSVNARDVHNAWAAWMQEQDPSHRSLRRFEELDPETQRFDEPFVDAIRGVARRF